MEVLKLTESGIVCDNPACDWEDKTVVAADTANWLNRPCPKCGENLLTQQDLDNYNIIMASYYLLNSLSKEEHEVLAKMAQEQFSQAMESDLMKDCKGKEILLDPDAKNFTIRYSTHKEIKAKEIFIKE